MSAMPGPAPPDPDDINDLRNKVLTSNYFGLCYLMLCQLSYAAEDSGPQAVQQIKTQLSNMPVPQNIQGQWRLAWGPQIPNDGSNSNLMYAAELLDTQENPPVPVFSAVVIRGTDTQAKPSGVLAQIIEDLLADRQVAFPEGNTDGAKIALGSSIGLGVLNAFADPVSGQSVEAYLQNFVAHNPGAPIVVTGHSLGGCQTTVMATYLSTKLPAGTKIVPNTFAAPTAGNSAFIQLYEKNFPFSPRWFNNIDLVPKAFANLGDIRGLWAVCGRPAPLLVKIAVQGLADVLDLAHATYAQQSDGESRFLAGQCQPPATSAAPAPVMNEAVLEIKTVLENAVKEHLAAGRIPSILQALGDDVSKIPLIGALGGVAAHLAPPDKVVDLIFQQFSLGELTGWVQELLFQHLILTGYWNTVASFDGVASIPNPFPLAAAAGA